MAWHLAPSLVVLRAEINGRWPGRDRTSDGSIGDTAHSSRSSDHNPNSRRSVNAIDIDEDGVDMAAIKAAIQRHPSAHYWIYERRIADRDNGWRPVPYDGDNPHDKHLHVSIRQTTSAEQDRRPWGLIEEDDMDSGQVTDAVWAVKAREYVDQDGNKIRDPRTPLDVLYATHAAAVRSEGAVAALTSVVEQMAATIRAGGGSVDTVAILAGVDERLTRLAGETRDAVADLGEGGSAQVRADADPAS